MKKNRIRNFNPGPGALPLPVLEEIQAEFLGDERQQLVSEKTYVVVGHQARDVTRELDCSTVSIIYNQEYISGMLSSFRAGLRHISQQCSGILAVLGDQPTITSAMNLLLSLRDIR